MKILQVVQSLGKGGAERLVLDISQAIKEYHPEVSVRIVALNKKNEYQELSKGLDIVYCNSYVKWSILGKSDIDIAEYERIVDDFNPDIIHSHTYTAELVSREHIRENIIYVTHTHNNMPEFESFSIKALFFKSLLAKFLEKQRMISKYQKCSNRFVSISNDTSNFYGKNLPSSIRKNIYYLPNAINYQKFHKKKIFDFTQKLRLINVGSYQAKKNQKFLIDLAIELRKRSLDFELLLLGNGYLFNKISQQIEINGLQGNVIQKGNVSDVEHYLWKSDIYVHSALYEPFGLVLLEAMSAGLPVVTLDGKGNRDLIEEGKNGYMIYEQNAELFADKILEIWNDKQKYQAMSQYAQEYAKRYDIGPYVDRLLEIYKR